MNRNKSEIKTFDNSDEGFSLDKNFGVLAEEIKKRMKLKNKNKDTKSFPISKKNDITVDAKKELLPLLKSIETLINKRDNYSEKINSIDEELEKVKSNIVSIKASYEKNISELKNNINFFEQSISLIDNIKGEE